jgi:predicted nucleic acid-binding protein
MGSGLALDTNVYIDALRDRNELAALKQFIARLGHRVWLAGVVAMELGAGALTDAQQQAVDDLVRPYVTRDRVFGVSFDGCREAGRALGALATRERVRLATAPPSLTNDALLAVSCREADVMLVTRNFKDFSRLQRQLRGFRFIAPWP